MRIVYKRIATAAVALFSAVSLIGGCAKKEEPAAPVELKVWGAQEDQDLLSGMIDAFKTANSGKTYNISLGVVSEADAKTRLLEDPAQGADVFAYPNDQLYDLVNAGALYQITRNVSQLTTANGQSAIEAASVGADLYGYPMTADNGYFLYYDKSVLSADDVKNLDTILEKCSAAGKKMFMDVSNGWYIASFFLGAGGTLTVKDGKQVCDFNNANGVAAGEAIKAFTANPAFLTGDDAVLQGGIGDTIAAGVSGTWNQDTIKAALGDNYAAAKLPTFSVGGSQKQMGSFAGYKVIGINSQTKSPTDAMDLAEWLTNEANQLKRFDARGFGPSNIKAAASPQVLANPAIAALSAQGQYATGQKDVLGTYWAPAEAFGTAMENKDYSKPVQELLNEMVAQIQE
jgi:arabinogalactan oligomer/maltooligosaccharide transport system substrate-binding protein